MYAPSDKMKVNKFVHVHIPRKCEYMQRFGRTVAPSSQYTGDEYAPLPQDKVSMLADADAYDKLMQAEEQKASQNDG